MGSHLTVESSISVGIVFSSVSPFLIFEILFYDINVLG